MKYVDEYRDDRLARRLVDSILQRTTRRWVLMDVCGGQTHGLIRHGIEDALSTRLELIHGPGCPVCVTSAEAIEFARELSLRDKVTVCSFGDMMRVPGHRGSLLEVRSRGGAVTPVYAPMDAVKLAADSPEREFVFFAVGFETTAPATALAVLQAERLGLKNFSLLVAHVRVLPAMRALMESPDHRIEGFLAAGHVCTVTGYEDYDSFADRYRVPVAITGFEPIDLLRGIDELVGQLEEGRCEVVNCYSRSVRREGNRAAMETIHRVYEVSDQDWRGFGTVAEGGLRLREEYLHFDAMMRFDAMRPSNGTNALDTTMRSDGQGPLPVVETTDCRGGEVLAGRIKPTDCEHFGGRCDPEHPLGGPMVSSESACAAYYRYGFERPLQGTGGGHS